MAKAGKPNSRLIATRLLSQVMQGRSLSELLETGLSDLDPRDRGFVRELLYGTCRWYVQLEGIAENLLSKPLKPKEREIKALVLLGLYQLMHMRVAPHAAVAESAEVARRLRKNWAVGLVNAVLRRFQREREALLSAIEENQSSRYAMPEWLLQRLQQAWPERCSDIAHAFNQRPPMSLRVNRLQLERDEYQQLLADQGIHSSVIDCAPEALILDSPVDVEALPGFDLGQVAVQDAGAQLAARLLDVQPGQTVLDACAAPGGKTCHILELAAGKVELTAMDVDASRLQRVQENLQRLQLQARAQVGDAAEPAGEWSMPGYYDRILLDVPCSATGVIRRHPDIKLLRRDSDIQSLVQIQRRILNAVWPLLKPGGMLLYATCSLLPEENQQQVQRFLTSQPDAREQQIDASWGHACSAGWQTLPGEQTMDGFYYACLLKEPAK